MKVSHFIIQSAQGAKAVIGDPAAAYVSGRAPILDVGSPRALSLALQSINDCIHAHRECSIGSSTLPSMPTRVIDCEDSHNPHLATTDGVHERYAALSYVWGEPQPHMTTTRNIAKYMHSIDVAHLPRTILDAIQVVVGLGLRYLWVDTLCIIQDSTEDRDHEVAQMQHIYRDAYITIIAAIASKVSEGFLHARPATLTAHDANLPFALPGGTGFGTLWANNLETATAYDRWDEPTSRRGWCFQEYLLSPRALIFASHTLHYHCQRSTTCVGGACHPSWIGKKNEGRDLRLPTPAQAPADVAALWREILEGYTMTDITIPDDRLSAIAGVAEVFHAAFRTPYLAGLWRAHLLDQVTWRVRTNFEAPRRRPLGYRAPSWSWAAADDRVLLENHYGIADVHYDAEVLQCTTVLKNDQLPFGQVTDGILVIRARAVACQVRWDEAWRRHNLYSFSEGVPDNLVGEASTGSEATRGILIGTCNPDSAEDALYGGRALVLLIKQLIFKSQPDSYEGVVVVPHGSQYSRIGKYHQSGYGGEVDRVLLNAPFREFEII